MSVRAWIAILAVLLTGPALAQTDDRISNDAMMLLGADAVVTEIGTLCIADTGSDPLVVAAFDGWRERNQSWRIVAVTTLGTRGVAYTASSLKLAQQKWRDDMLPKYEAAENKPDWCRRMANDIETGQLTAATLYPEGAKRVEEAGRGNWPVLDVENSWQVSDATEVLAWFDYNQQLMARCAETFGDPRRLYADAYPYWRSRNIELWVAADRTMTNWGAFDPRRLEKAHADNAQEIEETFAIDISARGLCEDFVATVEDGGQDIATIDGGLAQSVMDEVDTAPY